ncbi:asparagine synthase (glutamine-hydrolyzing) [Cytophaga aurantiaca]|uniref:asparagine synthase (glutamine-hydrolyzing) n=1 Tax=Cytophaga aurantiaca TaxID=29530 RepID=UPI0003755DC9|nr:asparagine synthase (glutamine-hydrolyzing) [Cytophaga aurantiaca]
MCGITGIFAFNQIGSFYMINLGKSIELLAHRGPDGRGTFVDDLIALGHRRLSIIDTMNGRQPMHDVSDRYVIVFNGEIFNYKQIKEALIAEFGCMFNTESDTEVLLSAYIHWGVDCLLKLNGFFAFAIYDKQTHEIFVARDRLGVKPLLYYMDEDKFIFASEMKSVLAFNVPREIDWASVRQYFTLGYIPEPNSIFKNIKKVQPGSYLLISKAAVTNKKYYSLPEKNTISKTDSFEDAAQKVKALFEQSITDRLVADVPVGAFLSGGIDSSIVVAATSRQVENLHTFSVGFKDASFYDETKSAELVAKTFNTNHTSIMLSRTDLADNIMGCLDSMSEPFGDTSALPFFVLSKKVAPSMKVILSGDGADELFGGYNKHRAEWMVKNPTWQIRMAQLFQSIVRLLSGDRSSPIGDKVRQVQKLLNGMHLTDAERYYLWCSILPDEQQTEVLDPSMEGKEEYILRKTDVIRRFKNNKYDLNTVLNTDLELVLGSDMLHKVDSMSMAHGLEVREPFLDYRLLEYVSALPSDYKVNKDGTKMLLKEAFKDELPKEILTKPKHGFDVPLTALFSKELKTWILDELLSEDLIKTQKIFNWNYIQKMREAINKNSNLDETRIWSIIVFQYWWKKYMN